MIHAKLRYVSLSQIFFFGKRRVGQKRSLILNRFFTDIGVRLTGLLFIICVSRQKYLVKTTGRKILQKLNDSSALTLGLVDPDIFFFVEQVEVDLQMCMSWSHLLSERRRLSFRNILTTWLTISTNRNNLKRKYQSKEPYDI